MKIPKEFPIYIFPVIIIFVIVVASIGFTYLQGLYFMLTDSGKLPCDQLPAVGNAEAILSQHNDTIERIMDINPGNIWFSLDKDRCPGKGEILIYYATVYDKQEIKDIIGDDFFGVPYRMFNV